MEDIKKIKKRIDWFCQNKVNAFSPTISPAPKSVENNEIESILEGVSFYFNNGVRSFVFQKKYMGSYCDIYLCKNIQDTYFISRNGHKITHINLDEAIAACETLYSKFDWDRLECVIIQSEILPWRVLGKGLINNEFEGYLNAHQNHYNVLKHSTLYDKLQQVKQSELYTSYIHNKATLPTTELKKKYPAHIIRQYGALEVFQELNLVNYKKNIDIYASQIAHFGAEGKLHFKAFNILKYVYSNGTEHIPNSNLTYSIINDDPFITLDINEKEDLKQQLQPVYNWFNTLQGELDEGIMIKPVQAFIKKMPPAFKVRNNNYLTMIYGIDFLPNFAHNIEKRQIKQKLQCSINDWMINFAMLQTPYKEINTENYAYKNLVLDRILGESIENNLDHRL